jgi:uncharacterized RDD family membrane protein YckC
MNSARRSAKQNVNQYVSAVMHNVHASSADSQRIEADLRAHLEEAIQRGEPPQQAFERMGSPEEVAAAFMSQVNLAYSSFWRRLAAFAIDVLLILIPTIILGILGTIAEAMIPPHPQATADYAVGALAILGLIACTLAALCIFLLYFPLLEGRFGQTLGMQVLKENGLPIGYREAFLRRISFYFDIFPFDALFIFFTQKHQRGFDIIARTVVIDIASSRAA